MLDRGSRVNVSSYRMATVVSVHVLPSSGTCAIRATVDRIANKRMQRIEYAKGILSTAYGTWIDSSQNKGVRGGAFVTAPGEFFVWREVYLCRLSNDSLRHLASDQQDRYLGTSHRYLASRQQVSVSRISCHVVVLISERAELRRIVSGRID
ncbi:hypothetical protein BDV28DRAFT_36986 [Aspergillus coremiiformis]|uniref:Uncharacterized protein n=1 Tax=Aspergillus coremiiformis TaxID=138285 RepID=A0A5N6Z0S0_9EURO|nr:hypothetical protein BDV28DRAFT_36986 [Aspergillus coremiiformis]